jgi:hypothetical protein
LLGRVKPQRLHVSGEAGKRGGGEVERAAPRPGPGRVAKGEYFPASPRPRSPALPKPVRSHQERIGQSLDADRGVRTVAAVDHGKVRQ